MPISIIIPALNEAESIGHVVREMPWHMIAECIVVDNGSTDATAANARAAGARVLESPRGYGAACLAGSNAALSTSDILVYMDGDGSDIIANLPLLTGPIAKGEADFVLCSRIRGNREPGSMLPSQVFAAHLVSTLLRIFQGVRYTDMGPFRAIRRRSLEALQMSELTYGWNLEMQIKAASTTSASARSQSITADASVAPARSPATSAHRSKPAFASSKCCSASASRRRTRRQAGGIKNRSRRPIV